MQKKAFRNIGPFCSKGTHTADGLVEEGLQVVEGAVGVVQEVLGRAGPHAPGLLATPAFRVVHDQKKLARIRKELAQIQFGKIRRLHNIRLMLQLKYSK